MDPRGFEPLTFSLRTRRATNCAKGPETAPKGYQGCRRVTFQPALVEVEDALSSGRLATMAADQARGPERFSRKMAIEGAQ